jgi:hypothetical protein
MFHYYYYFIVWGEELSKVAKSLSASQEGFRSTDLVLAQIACL